MRRLLIKLTDVHLQYPLAPLGQRSIKQALLRPFDKPSSEDAYVEALRGVSFSVSEGERLGIVGANGAGKSTLLRLMAGIYTPTSGSLHVSGTPRSLFDLEPLPHHPTRGHHLHLRPTADQLERGAHPFYDRFPRTLAVSERICGSEGAIDATSFSRPSAGSV